MNSLFSDFFREFWRGGFRGCSGLFRAGFGEVSSGNIKVNESKNEESYTGTNRKNQTNPYESH